jgi:hypothetical protein
VAEGMKIRLYRFQASANEREIGLKTKAPLAQGFFFSLQRRICLCFFLVLVFELLYAACGIYEEFLAGEEGVRSRAYFDFDDGVFLAIFELDGFFRSVGRTAQEFMVAGRVPKNNVFILRVNTFFHIDFVLFTLKGLQR